MIGGINGYSSGNNYQYSIRPDHDHNSSGQTQSEDENNIGKALDEQKKPGRKSSPADCETCKNRKYQDGSDESDVSFQTAQHIDPAAAGSRVRAHEQEHVTNAYQKAKESGGKVLSVGVSIHTAICPECGRVYVAGGVTKSTISTPVDDGKADRQNPYDQQKAAIGTMLNTGIRANYTT